MRTDKDTIAVRIALSVLFFGEKQKRQRFHKIKYIEQKQKENCKKKVLKKPDFTVFL